MHSTRTSFPRRSLSTKTPSQSKMIASHCIVGRVNGGVGYPSAHGLERRDDKEDSARSANGPARWKRQLSPLMSACSIRLSGTIQISAAKTYIACATHGIHADDTMPTR